ncbi:MAG: hypothetical protein RR620_08855 [Clostridium sp.]
MQLTIKAAAKELGISDKALYKRIKDENFDESFIVKEKGKTLITKEGIAFLKTKVRTNYTTKNVSKNIQATAEEEVAATVIQLSERQIKKADRTTDDENDQLIISKEEYNLLKNLKEQVEFLKSQLNKQSDNHTIQLDTQAKFYQEVLDKHIESSNKHIETMQEIVKNEQENTKAILDYEARSREVDDKLLKLRESMEEKRVSKKKKHLFGFFS